MNTTSLDDVGEVEPAQSGWMQNLPDLLRILGAGALIIAMYGFLVRGWQSGNDVSRYLMLLGHTGLLSVIGLASGHWLKEAKSARLLVTLYIRHRMRHLDGQRFQVWKVLVVEGMRLAARDGQGPQKFARVVHRNAHARSQAVLHDKQIFREMMSPRRQIVDDITASDFLEMLQKAAMKRHAGIRPKA